MILITEVTKKANRVYHYYTQHDNYRMLYLYDELRDHVLEKIVKQSKLTYSIEYNKYIRHYVQMYIKMNDKGILAMCNAHACLPILKTK